MIFASTLLTTVSPIGYTGSQGAPGPATSINATNDTSTTLLYPVMVGAAGSAQTPKVTTTRFSFNASTGAINQINPTSGSGAIVGEQTFRLTANGSAIGPTIADFFGATSSISLEASSVYSITYYCIFTKNTTAGASTYTLLASSAPSTMIITSAGSTPGTGIGLSGGAYAFSTASSANATTATTPANTGNLSISVNHIHMWQAVVTTNLATNLRLQTTQTAGTLTPLAGSYYTVKKISTSTGTFV